MYTKCFLVIDKMEKLAELHLCTNKNKKTRKESILNNACFNISIKHKTCGTKTHPLPGWTAMPSGWSRPDMTTVWCMPSARAMEMWLYVMSVQNRFLETQSRDMPVNRKKV